VKATASISLLNKYYSSGTFIPNLEYHKHEMVLTARVLKLYIAETRFHFCFGWSTLFFRCFPSITMCELIENPKLVVINHHLQFHIYPIISGSERQRQTTEGKRDREDKRSK